MPKHFDRDTKILNCVIGANSEFGELADIVKKWHFQGHELDKEKALDELSDVMWYIVNLATALDISMENVLEHNINKLAKRYGAEFSTEKSIKRADVNGED